MFVMIIMSVAKINAQENAPAGVKQTELTVNNDYIELADKFGGRAWDARIKKGVPKGTIITGWSLGALGGINSYKGPVYGVFVKNYFGWAHISIDAAIGEKMEIDSKLDQTFQSLGANVDFAISIAHFGGKKKVDTSGMSSYQAKKAIRNEKYGRMWRLYAGPSVGYQYCKNNTNFHYTDESPDVDEPGTVDFPMAKDGSSVKYGAVVGLEKRFFGSITKLSLEGRAESYSFKSFGNSYQPVYGSVTIKIEFGLGRRPGGGKF